MANNLTRFDPFNELVRADPFRNFDDMLKDFRIAPTWSSLPSTPRIKMDVTETDKNYVVKAEIPGVTKEDIKVSIEGNQVSISAETKKETEEKSGETVVRSERYYGQQYRSFTLACDVDEEKSEASYQNGVLELTLPKKSGPAGKQLLVK
ncbi:Hsp20/alpha crystallin family protein [Herminiimonas sp. CN]|uniref:Hsp20/alpha crystallin family protein n=1 Tax=Herminiimonas sp. CN TaxID=1349818 RepID=UPI0004742C01|nr:Hsp20/alpha crystallin family protein [Herminiimonas sp. CN]